MKSKLSVLVFIAFFIIGLVGANYVLNHFDNLQNDVLSKNDGNPMMDIQEESSSGTSTDIFDSNSNNVLDEESVIKVNADNFEEEVLKSTQKVLVDFYADWCEPCNLLSPLVAEVAKEHSDVKFVKVDTDENEKLANQYGVVYIPTLVLIENGDVVNRSVGYIEKAEIENLIK